MPGHTAKTHASPHVTDLILNGKKKKNGYILLALLINACGGDDQQVLFKMDFFIYFFLPASLGNSFFDGF